MKPITLSNFEPMSIDQMMRSTILEFIVFYLLFWWVMSILYKDNFAPNVLERIGNWIGHRRMVGKFFIGVSTCDFCLENHTASIMAIGYFCYLYNPSYPIDYHYLIWGMLCVSINSWIRSYLK